MLPPQPRALEALELALHIQDSGYNVYLAGEPNLGRTYMLKEFLQPRAKKMPTPPDMAYVYNFAEPDAPLLLELPAGQGMRFKKAMQQAMARLRKELPAYLERDVFTKRRSVIQGRYYQNKDSIVQSMSELAERHGFKLEIDDAGAMTLYPTVEGKRLNEQDFDSLADNARVAIKKRGDTLAKTMHSYMRRLSKAEQELAEQERGLEAEAAGHLLGQIFEPLIQRFRQPANGKLPESYFENLKDDIVASLDCFLPQDPSVQPPFPTYGMGPGHDGNPYDEIAHRYEVNLFVDNGGTQGAPIVQEDNPTAANLLGSVERESELGALVTNFTLIKAGALQRANGGFLILQMEDLLQHPQAWEGLLRALRSGQAKVEDVQDGDGAKTKGIQPAPLPLKVKVILVGNEDIYEALLLGDSRFSKLFKIKAQMTARMPRNAKGVKIYLAQIRRIIEDAELPHFTRDALAGLVDFGSLLLEDQARLSLEFPLLREIMVESAAQATITGNDTVSVEHLEAALKTREFRLNLVEEAFMEEYDRKLIRLQTDGAGIGVVNGLSVTDYGDFEFGLPHQISCTVGVGHDGIIDLEREAKLGGPIHTKAIMILKSYLVSMFARKKPLILSGSLCFEQSYAGIEGDSASGAELAALLSALAGIPIRLNLAFTGAVSQAGHIMAVGSVTRKVEGFFEVCKRHGLSGCQGVLLPKDNLPHLMLNRQVREAAEAGQFSIYPVEHITEAMELLTGVSSGTLRKDGTFTPGSLFHAVDRRLAELSRLAQRGPHSAF